MVVWYIYAGVWERMHQLYLCFGDKGLLIGICMAHLLLCFSDDTIVHGA